MGRPELSHSHFENAMRRMRVVGNGGFPQLQASWRFLAIESISSAPYTTDTSPDAMQLQLSCLRKMTPQQRIRKTCSMSRHVQKMAFDAIRRHNPTLPEEELQLRFIEVTYGAELADDVRRWQQKQNR